jgi:hypothetical protein
MCVREAENLAARFGDVFPELRAELALIAELRAEGDPWVRSRST